ncbi:MAG: WHG domain-containing protein [Clostridia bacterium]|nr:WHG domain-containing protein [Clostridia bacterium]
MPPKAKFTKEEVISTAFEMVKECGIEVLTARALGERLGSSARPIFTLFGGMEEIKAEVIAAAKRLYEKYEDEGMSGENAFKGSGIGYIKFAAEQPKLFRLLFMTEIRGVPDHEKVLPVIDDYYEKILAAVQSEYGFGRETANKIYRHLWIYSHGIASLIAMNVCSFSDEAVSEMLNDVGAGIIRKYKAEGKL